MYVPFQWPKNAIERYHTISLCSLDSSILTWLATCSETLWIILWQQSMPLAGFNDMLEK